MELTEKQKIGLEIAINRYKEGQKYTVISGYAGTGKAQPIDTIIPTPSGFRAIKELKFGDYVYDRYGMPTEILGIYPQGTIDNYIVTLEDGRQTQCNDEHLFSYYIEEEEKLETKSLKEMMQIGIDKYDFKIPVNKPIEKDEITYRVEPYAMGTFITCGGGGRRIPEEYKNGSVEQRFSLLQGLMDIHGTFTADNELIYMSASYDLVGDIKDILHSLGYWGIVEKYNTDYLLTIKAPNKDKYKFFFLKRKQDVALSIKDLEDKKDYSKISIVKVEKENVRKEMACIYVNNAEHLYLTNDYIVTHNTTLVNSIVKELAVSAAKIVYAAYTGKAADVLRRKGNKNAMTLHRLLYKNIPVADGSYIRIPKDKIAYSVVVVDECSMLPQDMVELLLLHNAYVIFLGDPFQLPPPLESNGANTLLDAPHIFLDEVMRQAQESDIIKVSMAIREGQPLRPFNGKDIRIVEKTELSEGMLQWADQILVATNAMRGIINNKMRMLNGITSKHLQEGEKVICTKNYWESYGSDGSPLVNGTIGIVERCKGTTSYIPEYIRLKGKNSFISNLSLYDVDMVTESGERYEKVKMDKNFFLKGEPFLNEFQMFLLNKSKKYSVPKMFESGYAITVHRAQGSQWNNVLIIEEGFPFSKQEHARWLYTAITRAASKVVVVLK